MCIEDAHCFDAGIEVSSQFFGESLAVAGLLTEPPWLGQETGHSHPGLLRGYVSKICAGPVYHALLI